MKLLIASILVAGAGAGGLSLSGARTQDAAEPCAAGDCRVEVECLDGDTCEVTCYDDAGDVVCREVVDCDAACGAAPGCAAR